MVLNSVCSLDMCGKFVRIVEFHQVFVAKSNCVVIVRLFAASLVAHYGRDRFLRRPFYGSWNHGFNSFFRFVQ